VWVSGAFALIFRPTRCTIHRIEGPMNDSCSIAGRLFRPVAVLLVVLNGGIAFCLALAFVFTNLMAAEPSGNDDYMYRVTEDAGPMYSWIRRGALFDHIFERADGSVEKTEFLYRGANGNLVVVSGNLARISQMVREEMDSPEQLRAFLKADLADIIEAFMAPLREYRISKGYMIERRSVPQYALGNSYDPKKIHRSLEILKNYVSDGEATVGKATWELKFHMQTPDGGVERWSLSGRLDPFAINDLKKTKVEKSGTVLPMPEAPGGR
jgi:hypothetical protein